VRRSTLADANEHRDWRVYADFAQVLITHARKLYATDEFGVALKQTAYAFDSTTIDLCLALFPWAHFRRRKGAVKLHTLLDLRGGIPCFVHVSHGKTHDATVLDHLIIEPGAFYIMDRGYIDFARLHAFTRSMAFFITRAKKGLDFTRRESRPTDRSTGLRSDQTIILVGPLTSQLYPDPLRRVHYRDLDTGKRFIFLTNNFDLPAVTDQPNCTSAAGRSNCSSSGSSSTCASRPSSAPPRTPSRPRSGSQSASTCSWPSSRSD
jgi:hypothetical protein